MLLGLSKLNLLDVAGTGSKEFLLSGDLQLKATMNLKKSAHLFVCVCNFAEMNAHKPNADIDYFQHNIPTAHTCQIIYFVFLADLVENTPITSWDNKPLAVAGPDVKV